MRPDHGPDLTRQSSIDPSAHIHATAVIDPLVVVGQGASIWHFCHISSGAEIGPRCRLGQNVYVGPGVKIGSGVKIQNNVSVYSGVILEDDVFVGPGAVFTNIKRPRAFVDQRDSFVATRVARGASIGANATIVCGVSLGEGCMVGAGAVVTKDVPAFAVVTGNPAVVSGRVDASGSAQPASGEVRSDMHAPEQRLRLLDPVRENADFQAELEEAALAVLRSGEFIMGAAVEKFESACCARLGVEHALAVSSGSDAVLMSLMAAGIGPGDGVLTTPFSFFAAAECVLRLGAEPQFVDINEHNYLIDVGRVLDAITPQTKAFVPVHLFGQAVDLGELRAELAARGIAIIEDAAQAWGARGDHGALGQGSFSACFSFFPSKNLGGFGDGGLITTGDATVAARLRSIRTHGAHIKYVHEQLGGNFRLDALHAALLSVKLVHLDELLRRRCAHAALYRQLLEPLDEEELVLPKVGRFGHSYNQFVVRCRRRDDLQAHLRASHIETAVYYPSPLHMQPVMKKLGLKQSSFPVAEALCSQALALPVHPGLRPSDIERISSAILQFYRRANSQ